MPLPSGTKLGPYEIVAPLGAGGMGEVYRARDTRLGRDVAVKVLPDEVSNDAHALARFRSEAKAVAALSHPNILALFDVGEADGTHYAVTELLEGESLRAALSKGPLAPRKALDLSVQIAEALAAAHDKGVVHRDLKPENVFLTRDGRAKLLDFGLAARRIPTLGDGGDTRSPTLPVLTEKGTVVGTVAYMSPEQAKGLSVDFRSDQFALGVVLYEMLAGQRPFVRPSAAQTLAAIIQDEPDPLERAAPSVPAPLRWIAERTLAKEPDARYDSTRDLARELADCRRHLGEVPAGAASPTPVRKSRAARAAVVAALVVFAATVGAVLTIGGRLWSRKPAAVGVGLESRRVAVVPFENETGDPALDSLGLKIADALASDLLQTGEVKVAAYPLATAPGTTAAPATSGTGAPDPLLRLAESTGSALVVTGRYYASGDQLEVQARLVAPWQGKLVHATAPLRVPRADPLAALEPLRQRMTGAVCWNLETKLSWGLGLSRPPRYDAFVEFRRALATFGSDYDVSNAHFDRARAIDPEFDWCPLIQSFGYGNQGRFEDVARELAVLEPKQVRMTAYERTVFRLQRAALDGRPFEVVAACRDLVALSEGAPANRYTLGINLIRVNRPAEAVLTLSGVPVDWKPAGDATIHWRTFYLAVAHHLNADYEGELRVARDGSRRFPDVLRFHARQAAALAALGRLDRIDGVVAACQSISSPPGSGSPGEVMLVAASELRAHGHREASTRLANRAAEWHRARPAEELRALQAREVLAGLLELAGRPDEATATVVEVAGEKPEEFRYRAWLGVLAARRGEQDEARRIDAELAALTRPYLYGAHLYALAGIAAQLGEKDRAVGLLREAFRQGLPFDEPIHRDHDLEPLRGYPPFDELMKPKG